MSSLRKRYRAENREEPPVSTAPRSGPADSTPTSADTSQEDALKKFTEADAPGSETSPAQTAASDAIKQRLQEMERAAEIEREAINQQPRYADEPQTPTAEQIIESTQLSSRAKAWLREHPEYISDRAKNSEIIALHSAAMRQAGGEEWTDNYFRQMEGLLGLRPQQNQRPAAAPVRQQYKGPTLSAPPHRDVPSMTSGRPQSFREPLTRAEVEIARAAGISDAEYQRGKERRDREKAAGLHQNG
jgi:hypothetical protein